MSTEPHTLFYSNQCTYCTMMMDMIQRGDLSNEFKKVDVHSEPVDLSRIRSVPTIIADHQQMMVGKEAFAWLQNKIKTTVTPHSYSISKGGFDSMSCPFSYIEDGAKDGMRNSAVSCFWSDANFAQTGNEPAGRSENKSEKAQMMDDAFAKLQADRDSMFVPSNHIRT